MVQALLVPAAARLDVNGVDYAILGVYFVTVLGIGFAAKRYVRTSLDYFLSGRSLPAWITGLAFVSANLGATEILGMGANGAQYGVATVNYPSTCGCASTTSRTSSTPSPSRWPRS
jgi:SSS family solute:Na+ symporter